MKVFISWSGERSHQVAIALRDWLPQVIQALEPWISSSDVEKGTRWGPDIARQLEASQVGIICLTPENLSSPWILFEAGALSKTLESTYVCPYLFDLQPTAVGQPLGQFQATRADASDTLRLLHTLNSSLGPNALLRERLESSFQRWWPDLQKTLEAIPPRIVPAPTAAEEQRTDRSLLEELLGLVRSHERGLQTVELSVQQMQAALKEKGTFVLSPILQEAAEWEALERRTAAMRKRLSSYMQAEAVPDSDRVVAGEEDSLE